MHVLLIKLLLVRSCFAFACDGAASRLCVCCVGRRFDYGSIVNYPQYKICDMSSIIYAAVFVVIVVRWHMHVPVYTYCLCCHVGTSLSKDYFSSDRERS